MATAKKKPRKADAGGERISLPPAFMRKAELIRELQIDRMTLDRLIAAGTVPPPYSRLSPKVSLWRRDHFRYFEANRRWPAEAFPSRQG